MRYLPLAILTAAAALAAAPALAQSLDELTVTGHGARAQSLSEGVSFADLNLNLRADRNILERRVSDTAGRLCDELNQDPASHHNMGRSCKDAAIRGAMDQMHQAFADAAASASYVNAYGASASATALATPYASARGSGSDAVTVVGNSPIPDTPQNRALYGGPQSRAGQLTGARGN